MYIMYIVWLKAYSIRLYEMYLIMISIKSSKMIIYAYKNFTFTRQQCS